MAPKLSKKEKAEAARLKAEQEAEEARLKAEQEEKERLAEEARLAEEERVRAEEEKRLQAELDARIDEEDAANAETYSERSQVLIKAQAEALARDEWAVFIACNPLPDVMSECAVNAFLTEWMEKPRQGADHLDATLADCTLCVDLVRSLRFEGAYAAARGDANCAAWQKRAQLMIRDEMFKKIDGMTADFLQRADEFANAKHECQTCIASPGCRYGLWVNLAKNPRIKSIDLAELNCTVELPKALALASIAVRVVHNDIDLCSAYGKEPETPPTPGLMSLGGVLSFSLLSLPPAAKKVKGWTMRLVTEMTDSVVTVQYPMPNADGSMPAPGTAPPLRITCVVAPHIILPDTVEEESTFGGLDEAAEPVEKAKAAMKGMTVGHWNEDKGHWESLATTGEQSISLVEFASETRTLSFQSTRLAQIALLQPTHLELPYKAWVYTPTSPSSAELFLETQRFSFHIEIGVTGCILRKPERPELVGILNTPMPATTLLLRLAACGINLSPTDVDALSLERITPKEVALETQMYAALTPLLARYSLAPSKWNPSRGPKKCTVRLKAMESEDAAMAMDGEEVKAPVDPYAKIGDWPTLEYQKRRVLFITALDSDATCDDAPQEGAVAHSTPLECLKGQDPDVLDSLHSSSPVFTDSTRQLFDQLRLMSFTMEPPKGE